MEFGTREQKELLFATGVQQDFPLGAWRVCSLHCGQLLCCL